MSSQRLVFTALPNGTTSQGERRLSVFISPRLTPGPGEPETLESFPGWEDWPDHLPKFQVFFDSPTGTLTLDAATDPESPAADLSEWKELFDYTTPVKAHEFKKLEGRQIRSYRAKGLHDFLKQQYMEAATSNPTDYPSIETLKTQLAPIRYESKRDGQWMQALENEMVPPSINTVPFDAKEDFYRFQLFHRPASDKQMVLEVPKMDFHEIVGALARYPVIMRHMGLVIDLILPLDVRGLPASGRVRVKPSGEWKTPTTVVTPWTHFVTGDDLHPGEFMAQATPASPLEFMHGKLPVGDSKRYSVIQMDVDSSSFKTLNLAAELDKLKMSPFQVPRAAQGSTGQEVPTASLPAVNSTGLTLLHTDEAVAMSGRFVASSQNNARVKGGDGTDMDLYLEDLVRGYRIDVWDDATKRWWSLHRRDGSYEVGKLPEVTLGDEGWSMNSATATTDPTAADQALRIHETVAEWSGWSLSAPRPESVIGTRDEVQTDPGTPDSSTFKLKTTFKAHPHSLPRLRYGRTYKVVARSVDLAGNGPSLRGDDDDPGAISAPIVFRRYEPISQPVLIPRKDYKESESIEHLVVRTWTKPPSGPGYTEPTERHVAPPITTVRNAELHWMLDDPAGPFGFRADAYSLLTALEGSAPSDPVPDANWSLTYLADPAAHGASFTGLPGAGTVRLCEFDTDRWPKYHPFLLLVDGGSGAPSWITSGDHILKVQIPPAVVARVRMSCYPTQRELEAQMGAWRWVMEKYNPGNPEVPPIGNASYDKLLKIALEGRHWMVTPYREILLIHAIQQPIVPPKFTSLSSSRIYGDTFASIRYTTACDGKSTQKLDMTGEWTQQIDDITQPEPESINGKAHAFTTPVTPNVTTLAGVGRHEFGDTKHRLVKYSGTMLTRFPEFFPEGTTPLERTTDETGGPVAIHVPSSARPEVPHVQFVIPVFEWRPGSVGGGQQMTRKGNTVRVYLDRPWYSSGDDEKLGVILNVVPQYGTSWTPEQVKEIKAHYQTGWGLDPITGGGPVSNPLTAAHFTLGGSARSSLSLDEVPNSNATVIPHEALYDKNQKLWYCDIRVEPDAGSTAYWPFLRLALARYQPYSINGAHLSRIAQADFIQLAPDRTASVAHGKSAGEYNVSLSGIHASVHGTADPSRKVQVTVERQDIGGEDFGWTPMGQPTELKALVPSVYLGTLKVPLSASSKYRLVFKEYEKLLADPKDRSLTGFAATEVWRLIFAHAFEL